MKKISLFILLVCTSLITLEGQAQCNDDNINVGSANPPCPGSTTYNNIRGGRYFTSNVVNGNTYTYSTCAGGGFDTQLTLYNASSGAFVAYNDDACGVQSEIVWTATFTGTIRVVVDRYNCRGSNGSTLTDVEITCSVPSGPPSNNDPCGATVLAVNANCSYIVDDNSSSTSSSVADPSCGFYTGKDIWYSFVAPAGGSIGLDMVAAGLSDASMALYDATSCSGSFTELECDDNDGIGEMPSIIYSGLTAGTTYYVRVWGNNGTVGDYRICAHIPPDCVYTLHMFDLGGDGWGGSDVGIRINTGSWTNYTMTTGSKSEVVFEVSIGDRIRLRYRNQGGVQSEISYILAQGDGRIFADGPSPSTGTVFDQTADCVKPPAPIEDCVGGQTLCAAQTVNVNPVNIGITTDLNTVNRGCLGSNERQGQWYNFSPTAGGDVEMDIIPQDPTDDYDFAIWGPYSSLTCTPPENPTRCSYSGTTGNTGMAIGSGDQTEGAGGDKYVDELNVNAGEVYILYVSNWSRTGIASDINFNLSSGAELDCTILPIDLVNFEARPYESSVGLFWSTSSELNNEKFIIEHSTDGEMFSRIGEMAGAGTTNLTTSYSFDHLNPNIGINYYRLRQVDHNGQESVSQIVTALLENSVHAISKPYPNPSSSTVNLNIRSERDSNFEVKIIDAAGRVALVQEQYAQRGTSLISIPVYQLVPGSYTLTLTDEFGFRSSGGHFIVSQ